MNTTNSLEGLKVLDLSWLIPGPFCTEMLLEMGAEVIKIERPGGGDYMREGRPAEFEAVNRGKKSLVLDLKGDEGRAIFYRLCESADVIIESFSPGVVGRLCIDYKTVSKINPRIIYLSLSGYGQEGPYAKHPGHDINYLAVTGALSIPGRWGSEAQRSGLPLGDLSAALYAVINIQSALIAREKSGHGGYVDMAIGDAILHWTQLRLADSWRNPERKVGAGTWWAHMDPANEVYETKEGRKLALAIVEEKFVRAFRDVNGYGDAGHDQLFSEAQRCSPEGADAFRAVVSEIIKRKTLDEWQELLSANRIPFAPVATPAEVVEDAHFKERGMLRFTQNAEGVQTVYVPMPGTATTEGLETPSPAPGRGEHSREILEGLGLDEHAIDQLKEKNIVE